MYDHTIFFISEEYLVLKKIVSGRTEAGVAFPRMEVQLSDNVKILMINSLEILTKKRW